MRTLLGITKQRLESLLLLAMIAFLTFSCASPDERTGAIPTVEDFREHFFSLQDKSYRGLECDVTSASLMALAKESNPAKPNPLMFALVLNAKDAQKCLVTEPNLRASPEMISSTNNSTNSSEKIQERIKKELPSVASLIRSTCPLLTKFYLQHPFSLVSHEDDLIVDGGYFSINEDRDTGDTIRFKDDFSLIQYTPKKATTMTVRYSKFHSFELPTSSQSGGATSVNTQIKFQLLQNIPVPESILLQAKPKDSAAFSARLIFKNCVLAAR